MSFRNSNYKMGILFLNEQQIFSMSGLQISLSCPGRLFRFIPYISAQTPSLSPVIHSINRCFLVKRNSWKSDCLYSLMQCPLVSHSRHQVPLVLLSSPFNLSSIFPYPGIVFISESARVFPCTSLTFPFPPPGDPALTAHRYLPVEKHYNYCRC